MSQRISNELFRKRFYDMDGSNNFELLDTYQKFNIPVRIKCLRCDYIFKKTPNSFQGKNRNKCNCPKCDVITSRLIPGFNNLATKRPDISILLKNYEDGQRNTVYSDTKVIFICPQCHHELEKKIKDVVKNGLSCSFCSDGISYPNKFMAHILDNLGINFDPEYQINNSQLRFDFYFEINKIKYLVELDGALGHGVCNTYNMTVNEQIQRDYEKDCLAINNEYHLIRIDCKYKKMEERKEYVINSILNSELSNILNLKNIDFEDIDKKCNQSIIVQIGDSWNQGVCSYDDFEKIYHLKRPGIRRFLKQACAIGIISEDYKSVLSKIRLLSNKKLQASKGHRVQCIETGEIYVSIAEAQRKTGIYSIGDVLNGKRQHAGKLNGVKLSWKLVS